MNFKKAILITLFISVFLVGTLGAVNATNKTTTNSKVTKDTLKITAPKVTNTYKKSQNFKITVKNKKTGKAVKNVKATIKIGTKKYNKKTNNKGIININTKTLKPGTHKVVIQIKATKKYKATTTKSSIKIVKSKKTNTKKIKTSFYIYSPDYEYNDDGTLRGLSYTADLLDSNGNELKKPIIAQWSEYGKNQITSGESFFMGEYMRRNGYVKFIFEGDSKYDACSYTVNIDA